MSSAFLPVKTAFRHHRATIAICIALVAITWAVFGQTLRHGFLNYDDQAYVFDNVQVTGGLTIHGIAWAFTQTHSFNWHPLTWISHMLDCQWFGLNAGGHHFTSVLLHSLAAVLLFLVLWQMTNARWPSAFVAAVFAIHPLRVESVAWVAERKDVLSGVFFFLTLGAYLRYVRRPAPGRYLAVALFFAAGLMSKPMLVTLPVLLLILDYWPLNRFPSTSPKTKKKKEVDPAGKQLRALILEKIPLLVLSAASCGVTILAQKSAIATIDQFSFGFRLMNALVSYAVYIRQMFVPIGLTLLYPLSANAWSTENLALSVGLLLFITLLALVVRRKRPYLLAGWLWYLLMLLPVIGLIQVGSQAYADRYTYLPQIGLYIMIAWTVADLTRSWPYRRPVLIAASGLIVATLAVLAWKQTSYWRDSDSAWGHAIAVNPANHIALTNLGDSLLQQSRFDEAIVQYEKALKVNPKYSSAENGLGSAFSRKGMMDQAVVHYRKGLWLRPEDPEIHNNLGNALYKQGFVREGIAEYQKALELRLDPADVYNAETQFNLANALLREGNIDQAITHYRESLKIEPEDAETRDNLGTALMRRGRPAEAMGEYEKALKIEPHSQSILGDVAWALATCADQSLRNGPRAVELAEQARNLSGGKDPVVLRTLAAAYAESGQFPRAVESGRQALQQATLQNNDRLMKTLEKEIAIYQAGSTYRQR